MKKLKSFFGLEDHNSGLGFMILLWSFVTLLIVTLGFNIFCESELKYYYLDGQPGDLRIECYRTWGTANDGSITVDRNLTYDEAIEMVNKLNRGIPK